MNGMEKHCLFISLAKVDPRMGTRIAEMLVATDEAFKLWGNGIALFSFDSEIDAKSFQKELADSVNDSVESVQGGLGGSEYFHVYSMTEVA